MHCIRSTNTKIVILFFLVGFLVYSNALLNTFISDDILQIIRPSIVHSPKNIPLFFISSLRNTQKHGIFLDFYYKPMMFTWYSFLYMVGNGKPFVFHLFQLILHIINSLLIFFLFSKVFKKKISVFLSYIFLVHPVNEETVAFIANLQDVLFPFFGLLALVFLQHIKIVTIQKKIFLSALLLLALFSKDSGILSVGIAGIYVILFQTKRIRNYIPSFFIAIGVYGIFRLIASQFYFISLIPLMKLSFTQRVLYIPKIIVYYLREFMFPTMTFASAVTPTKIHYAVDVFFPLFFLLLLLFFLAIMTYLVWKKDKKAFQYFLFFLLWFLIGLGFHLQLFHLDSMVAKRWFYFPMIGLLGVIGFFIQQFSLQAKSIKIIMYIGAVLLISFLAYQTHMMNPYWGDKKINTMHMRDFFT